MRRRAGLGPLMAESVRLATVRIDPFLTVANVRFQEVQSACAGKPRPTAALEYFATHSADVRWEVLRPRQPKGISQGGRAGNQALLGRSAGPRPTASLQSLGVP